MFSNPTVMHATALAPRACFAADAQGMRRRPGQVGERFSEASTGAAHTSTVPKPGTTAGTDPLTQGPNGIKCTGANGGTGVHGRTRIRIGAYTFFDNRGRYIAKKVRSLWNAGCEIAIDVPSGHRAHQRANQAFRFR